MSSRLAHHEPAEDRRRRSRRSRVASSPRGLLLCLSLRLLTYDEIIWIGQVLRAHHDGRLRGEEELQASSANRLARRRRRDDE